MYSTPESEEDIDEGAEMMDDDVSSGSASSDSSNSEETTTDDTQPPKDVSNMNCLLKKSAKLFL